jgi:hypothetical protein
MTTPIGPTTARSWGLAARALAVLGLTALLGACSARASASDSAAVHQTCERVSAVLSDGPDPAVDPVGYAEAQFRPLGTIRTSDKAVGAAIGGLARAYRAYFVSNGSGPAKAALAAASRRINAICPGAAS